MITPEERKALLAKNRRRDVALKEYPQGLVTVEQMEALEERHPDWFVMWHTGWVHENKPGFRARRRYHRHGEPPLFAETAAELEALINQYTPPGPSW